MLIKHDERVVGMLPATAHYHMRCISKQSVQILAYAEENETNNISLSKFVPRTS